MGAEKLRGPTFAQGRGHGTGPQQYITPRSIARSSLQLNRADITLALPALSAMPAPIIRRGLLYGIVPLQRKQLQCFPSI